MFWIYILRCEDDYYYVGQTSRLYRRFWEHNDGNGGANTSNYVPQEVVAIYKVSTLCKFFEYDRLVTNQIYDIYFNRSFEQLEDFNMTENNTDNYDKSDAEFAENNIAECLMINDKECWEKIRGGKYTRFDVNYKFPVNSYVNNLPLCKCGVPCDIRKNEEHDYLYFRCPKKNFWDNIRDKFDIDDEPCNYFMKYTKDIEYKKEQELLKSRVFKQVSNSPWLKELLGRQFEFCVGGCGKEYSECNTVRYSRRAINLCFDCFIDKNDELKKKYTKPVSNVCLFTDD
jgi:hypothetical protein